MIVPDDHATVQAAIDSGADTVFVREGVYSESPEAYRGVTLRGLGTRRPKLAGLSISNPFYWLSLAWDVSGVDFMGPVSITTSNYLARYIGISFDRCALHGGVQHDLTTSTDPYDIFQLSLAHCRLAGESAARAAQVSMVSDTIDGGASWRAEDVANVQSCWFTGGSGFALALQSHSEPSGLIENNLIEGYQYGISVAGSNDLTIRNNVVRGMGEFGIGVHGSAGTINGNIVTECRTGILCSLEDIVLNDNVILHNRGMGVSLYSPTGVLAESNVIGRCGDTGFFIEAGGNGNFELSRNTVFENTGSGLLIYYGSDNQVALTGNVIYANKGWGLQVGEPRTSVTPSCNDWFANGLGAMTGAQASDSDFVVDPSFCDVDSDDVSLYSDSPLLNRSQCTQIGARGIGCSPPRLSFAAVASSRAGLGVRWEFEAASSVESWIERASQAAGPWDSLGTGNPTGSNSFELLDRAVAPDNAYIYRVAWRDRGAIVRGSPVSGSWTDAGRLSNVSPNPARGEVTIDWVLARPGATDIRVFDVAGREVSVVARGSFGVGRHQAQWDGRWDARGIAPAGMYIVRISSGERTTSHRILLLR